MGCKASLTQSLMLSFDVFCLRLLILAAPLGYGPFAQRKNQCCVGLDVAGALGVVGVWGLVGLFMDSS